MTWKSFSHIGVMKVSGRIDGDGFSFASEMLADDRAVERKPVESFMLKKVTISLF